MHKYIIMGVQGCGKGTQARLLKEWLDLVHISVGDIFRWHIQSHTKLSARIKRLVAEGELVPDDVVEEVVKQRLEQHDWNYGFILDGFPRNARQARRGSHLRYLWRRADRPPRRHARSHPGTPAGLSYQNAAHPGVVSP